MARATAPSNMSKAPPATEMRPAATHHWSPAATAATMAMPKPISVSMFGVRPSRAMPAA